MTTQGPPPGWYPHPDKAQTLGYWNGAAFTGDLSPMTQAPAVLPSQNGQISDTVQKLGWICALVFPIVGFAIGIMCVEKGQKRDGGWMIVISTFVGVATYLAWMRSAGY